MGDEVLFQGHRPIHQAFWQAFLAAQKEFGTPRKDGSAAYKNVKYEWSTYENILDAVKPALHKYGITFSHSSHYELLGDKGIVMIVTTRLTHAESGYGHEVSVPFVTTGKDAQEQGSLFTYGKRYTLSGVCGLGHETDTDGKSPDADDNKSKPRAGAQAGGAQAVKENLGTPVETIDPKNQAHRDHILNSMRTAGVKDADEQLDRVCKALNNRDFSQVPKLIERFYPYTKLFKGKEAR